MGKTVHRQNLDEGRKFGGDPGFFRVDRDCDKDAYRRPELSPHGVSGGSVKGKDAQALLHPTEEELDLSAFAVEFRYSGGWQLPLVASEGETHGLLQIVDSNSSHKIGSVAGSIPPVEEDGLIGPQRGRSIERTGSRYVVPDVGALADHEKRSILMNPPQAPQTGVAAFHPIEAVWLDGQFVHPKHIAEGCCSHVEECGQRSSQVQRGMELHRGLAASPVGPGRQGQAQVDQRQVHGVDRYLAVQYGWHVLQKQSRPMHQLMRQRRVQLPVPLLVRSCQGAAGEALRNTKMVSQSRRTQARLELPRALARGHLRGHQRQKMPRGRKLAPTLRLIVNSNQPLELPPRHPTDDLGKTLFSAFLPQNPVATATQVQIGSSFGDTLHATHESLALLGLNLLRQH